MNGRTRQILFITFGLQLLFIGLSFKGEFSLSFVQWSIIQMFLLPIGYGIGLYNWPKLAKFSVVLKMTIVAITSIVLTEATVILSLIGFILYWRLRFGVFPMWGHE